tara:strand:+ start:3333 stop:3932 length:600 start_codon:yes stop_codon:yes gene_type:complete
MVTDSDLFALETPGRVYCDDCMVQSVREGLILWNDKPGSVIQLRRIKTSSFKVPKVIIGQIKNIEDGGTNAVSVFSVETDDHGSIMIETNHGELWEFEINGKTFKHAGPLDTNLDGKVNASDLEYMTSHPYDWPSDGRTDSNDGDFLHVSIFQNAILPHLNRADLLSLERRQAFVEVYGPNRASRNRALSRILRARKMS